MSILILLCFQPNAAGNALKETLKDLDGEDIVIPLSVTTYEDRYLEPLRLLEGIYEITVNRYDAKKESWQAFKTYAVPIDNAEGNFVRQINF